MIALASTESLRITTTSSSPIAVTAVWSDDGWATSSRTETSITSATTTTIVAAPSSGTREVRAVSVYNARTGAEQSVEPQRYDGTVSTVEDCWRSWSSGALLLTLRMKVRHNRTSPG